MTKKPKVVGSLLSMLVETREELLAAREELRGQDRKVEYLERDNTKLREDVADLKRHAELLKADIDERNECIRQLEEVNEERFQHQQELKTALAKAAREPDALPRYEVYLMRSDSGKPVGWQVWDRVKHETWGCWIDNGQRTLDEAEAVARRQAKRLNEEDA